MNLATKIALINGGIALVIALINAGTEITIHRLPYQYGLLQDGQCGIIDSPRHNVDECHDKQ
jgi:hypothetical protein